jgi:hypothetical protein
MSRGSIAIFCQTGKEVFTDAGEILAFVQNLLDNMLVSTPEEITEGR